MAMRAAPSNGLADVTRWQTVFLPYKRDELTRNTVDGQIVDVRGAPPPERDSIMDILKLILHYPVEGKLWAQELLGSASQLTNGQFSFTNIPQGTHRLVGMYVKYYVVPAETTMTTMDVTVYPAIGAHDVRVRLNVDWNNEP